MATFPNYKPVYAATKKNQPKATTTSLGDGYIHRVTFGLNQNPKSWELTFNLSEAEADEVEDFLDARAFDTDTFSWTPPGSAVQLKWTCESWNRELFDYDRSKITATFVQKFEPDTSNLIITTVPHLTISRGSINNVNNRSSGDTAVDASGNSYHAFLFSFSDTSYQEIIVAKRSAAGVVLWCKSYGGGPGYGTSDGLRLAMSPDGGNLYVLYAAYNSSPIYLWKIRFDGVLQWSKIIGSGFSRIWSLGVNPATQNIYIGFRSGSLNSRMIVLDPNGTVIANKQDVNDGPYADNPTSFAFDDQGNAYYSYYWYPIASGTPRTRLFKISGSTHAAITSKTFSGTSFYDVSFNGYNICVLVGIGSCQIMYLDTTTLEPVNTFSLSYPLGSGIAAFSEGGFFYVGSFGGGTVMGYVTKLAPDGSIVSSKRVSQANTSYQALDVIRNLSAMPGKEYITTSLETGSTFEYKRPSGYTFLAFTMQPGTFNVPMDTYLTLSNQAVSVTISDYTATKVSASAPTMTAGPSGLTEASAVSATVNSPTVIDRMTAFGWITTTTETYVIP